MLTIKALAERWGMTQADAKNVVRHEGVPFIALRSIDLNIVWRFVRFDPKAVEEWEGRRVQRCGDGPRVATAETVVFRKLR